jgi:DNA-binding transcriptional LysR family regulator
MSKIDLNLFVVFNAIYSQQNLTRAAEVLHVSQPAVSNALARLRERLDDPLFVRGPGGMQPTPLARQLIGPVKQALETLDDCVKSRSAFEPLHAQQTVRLHITEQAELMLLPRLSQRVREQAPGIKLEILSQDRRDVPLALAAGNLQLAVDAPLLSNTELLSQPLLQDDYVCVMREGHPLAGKELTMAAFLNTPHIHISSRLKGSGHVDLALRSIGKQRHIAVRLQHYASLPELINTSDYIAAIPQLLAQHWPSFAQATLPFEPPKLELQLFWHKSVDHDPMILWLQNLLVDCLR